MLVGIQVWFAAFLAITLLQVTAASQPKLWPKWYAKAMGAGGSQAQLDAQQRRTTLQCLHVSSCGSEHCGFVRCKKRPNGYGCHHHSECVSGSCYRRNVCVTHGEGVLANNEQCYTSSECASGYCSRGYCDDKKTVGHACHKAAGCISNKCWNNHCQQASSQEPEGIHDDDGGDFDTPR